MTKAQLTDSFERLYRILSRLATENVLLHRRIEMELSKGHKRLCEFYDVKTLEQLVDAQAQHIERLQQKLQKASPFAHDPFPASPRKG